MSDEGQTGASPEDGTSGADAPLRSLLRDVEALIDDARNWLDAEVNFQKSRAAYLGSRIKVGVALGLGALFFLIMALFGLVVGLLLALTPLISAWGATAVVVGALLLGAGFFVLRLKSMWETARRELDEGAND